MQPTKHSWPTVPKSQRDKFLVGDMYTVACSPYIGQFQRQLLNQ